MAEIKIEKKRPIWPWVLVTLLVLALVIYFVYENREDEDYNDDFNDDVTTEQIDSINSDMDNAYDSNQDYSSTFDEFSAFENSISDSTRIAVDSSYTKKAFSNLAKAVVNRAEEDSLQDSEALTDLRAYTTLNTTISSTPNASGESKNFKTASDKVAKVLEAIQAKNYPELQSHISDLNQITSKIDGSVSMEKQQAALYAFFSKSKEVLEAMNN